MSQYDLTKWEDVQEHYTLAQVVQALRWFESNKQSHARYYEKRKQLLALAKEHGLDKDL